MRNRLTNDVSRLYWCLLTLVGLQNVYAVVGYPRIVEKALIGYLRASLGKLRVQEHQAYNSKLYSNNSLDPV